MQGTTKEKCKFFCRDAEVSKDVNLQLRVPSETSKFNSESELESQSREAITKKIQMSSNYKQNQFAHTQGYMINNLEIERETVSKSNEESSSNEDLDDRLESEQIMVPTGEW